MRTLRAVVRPAGRRRPVGRRGSGGWAGSARRGPRSRRPHEVPRWAAARPARRSARGIAARTAHDAPLPGGLPGAVRPLRGGLERRALRLRRLTARDEQEASDGGSQATTLQHPWAQAADALEAQEPRAQRVQPLQQPETAPPHLSQLRLLRRRRDRPAARRLLDPGDQTMSVIPRIGIDAMGGDLGPSVVAAGTVLAFREMPGRFSVTLVGDEAEIRPALRRAGAEGMDIEVVHAAGQVDMGEKAAAAARRRGSTSIGVMTQLHKEGKVDAVFSAGNTGAVVATALLGLGRLEAVSRPALAAFFPSSSGGCVVLDVAPTPSASPRPWCNSRTWARSTRAICSAATIPASGCCRSARRTPRATISCSSRCRS